MKISVVIPTRNRPDYLKRVLLSLQHQTFPPSEIIIIDASDNASYLNDITQAFINLSLVLLNSIPSVCIQRNKGINAALHNWVFLCDDDLELPESYLSSITNHIKSYPQAGAITGIVLQKQNGQWIDRYPVTSAMDLLKRYIFQLSIWGPINVQSNNFAIRFIKRYYNSKDNHLSKAGWPVITNFSGSYFKSPVYGLGASVIKKEWLINSPYDEVLDPHGIGDNYGVALRFPKEGIHILNTTFVYHCEAKDNRLPQHLLYYRRALALNYFLNTNELANGSTLWLIWSLSANLLSSLLSGKLLMVKVNLKLIFKITFRKNPYTIGKDRGLKIITPEL